MIATDPTRRCMYDGCVNKRHGAELCTGHERQRWLGRELAPLRPHARVVDGMKLCATCDTVKPIDQFGKKRHYVTEFCKDCRAVKLRAGEYGLSMDEVRAMLARSTCECCGSEFANSRDQHVDHCHRTGAVRGLICRACNVALGCVDDDADHLRRLISYLEQTAT